MLPIVPIGERKVMNKIILTKLRDLKFIGFFPKGIEVLLVPIDTAYREINFCLNSTFTKNTFRTFLTENDIFMFGSVDDWAKFKDPAKFSKKHRRAF
jgi:hypothetical protein